MKVRVFEGGCHCGAIRVSFHTAIDPEDFVPRSDTCSFCLKHKSAAISDPNGQLEIEFTGRSMSPYRFGTGITDFHVCCHCGVLVAATRTAGQICRGLVNPHSLDQLSEFTTRPVEVSFDGETLAERVERRRANWTPAKVCLLAEGSVSGTI